MSTSVDKEYGSLVKIFEISQVKVKIRKILRIFINILCNKGVIYNPSGKCKSIFVFHNDSRGGENFASEWKQKILVNITITSKNASYEL